MSKIPDVPFIFGPNAYIADCVPEDTVTHRYTSETGVEYVRTDEKWFTNLTKADFPYQPLYTSVEGGMRMHYIDEGPRDGEIILMMHGMPTWCYSFRKMIPVFIARGYRTICVDHIGMGRSDKPVGLEEISYTKQVSRMKEFIQKTIPEALESPSITLHAQDWGSLIGLRVAGDESSWFRRIVIANGQLMIRPTDRNPYDYLPSTVDYNCSDTRTVTEMQMDRQALAMQMACGPIDVTCHSHFMVYALNSPVWINHVAQGIQMKSPNVILSSMELAQYSAPFPSSIYSAAIRSFPSASIRVQEPDFGNTAAWETLKKFDRPFLSLAGELDPLSGRLVVTETMINNITGAKVHSFEHKRYAQAGHFIQEDVGAEMAAYVSDFIDGTPMQTTSSAYMSPTFTFVPITLLLISSFFRQF